MSNLSVPNSEYYVMGLEQQILLLISFHTNYKLKTKIRLCSKFLAKNIKFTKKDYLDYLDYLVRKGNQQADIVRDLKKKKADEEIVKIEIGKREKIRKEITAVMEKVKKNEV